MAKKKGRPQVVTKKIEAEIIERLENGETARSICRRDDMPCWSTLCLHNRQPENEAFSDQYAYARKRGMLARMDDIWERVQDTTRDVIYDEVATEKDGKVTVKKVAKSGNTAVQRDKLIADQARWEAARIYKVLFGETVKSELTGKDGKELQAFAPVLNITIKQSE